MITYHPVKENGSFKKITYGGATYILSKAELSYEEGNAGDFTVAADGSYRLRNHLILTDLTVKKTDNGAVPIPLGGAEFKLTRKDKNGMQTAVVLKTPDGTPVTNSEGVFSITEDDKRNGILLPGLVNGDYVLTELKAPDGYVILEGSLEFTVLSEEDEQGDIQRIVFMTNVDDTGGVVTLENNALTLTVRNTPGAALPSTGGRGTFAYTLSGLLFIAAALMYRFGFSRFGFRRRERRAGSS